MGQWVTIKQEGTRLFSGYLALPPREEGPGLMILQEIWGVNAHIRALADQYAAEGFVVLAPDVFWRQETKLDLDYSEPHTRIAYEHYQALDYPLTGSDLSLAVDFLVDSPLVNGKKVGVVGFCMGGRLAFSLTGNARLAAGVSYYGSGIAAYAEQLKKLEFPFLFHFAELDHLMPIEEVGRIMPMVHAAGVAQVYVYNGAQHGFNCPFRASYSRRDALLAKARTLEFLAAHM
ncbi:dienelactone hydrolase family protein [Pseudomonas fluorescens]|uniref:Carboxymethylenebutenolidase n=1 Tax=Pseudomonas fluorescens TaxID=294 RepID=A0A5E7BE10_PSEFL|nr:dienelactone hydrolase family protein [Pseudomonas fluorescens]VVN90066.1 Carboxymethylenebutenolidase [Pseudomonas fluorescens]